MFVPQLLNSVVQQEANLTGEFGCIFIVLSGGELATEFLYFVLLIHRDTTFLWSGCARVFQKRYKRSLQENTEAVC